jgi:dTDP-4-amino-4,6-dideoxygalactose transaminase
MLAGVGAGDEVITPAFNNIADFQAILATGATPVFCDVRDDTLCIDPDRARALVGPKSRVIIATDYAAALCDHGRIDELAGEFDLRVIHDAAHSLGATSDGRPVGSFSDLCTFSFDPVKTITCIDGGAVVVGTREEADQLRESRLIGMGQPAETMYRNQRAWTYDVKRLGFRYHMANLHARIGLAQLGKIDRIAESRRHVCRSYHEAFSAVPEITIPEISFETTIPFLYYVRVPASCREAFRDHLAACRVDTGIHWQPGHWFSLFKDCPAGDLSVTETAARQIVSLPLHACMDPQDCDRVIDAVREFF